MYQEKNYYDVLEINEKASLEEIKIAYRNKITELHPDKNHATDVDLFNLITEAHQILSDQYKREEYDKQQCSKQNKHKSFTLKHGEIIKKFVNNILIHRSDSYKIMDLEISEDNVDFIECTLMELYKGTTKQKKIVRELIDRKKGINYIKEDVIQIKIEAGYRDNTRIIFNKMGREHLSKVTGNLIIIIKEQEHPIFKKYNKNDIIMKLDISLKEAHDGFTRQIELINGEKCTIDIEPIENTKFMHRLKNHGMPVRKNGHIAYYSVLYIGFNIDLERNY